MPATWPWSSSRQLDDLQATTDRIESDTNSLVASQGRITRTLERLERIITAMADQSALLNSVAEGLRSLGSTVSTLVAENATLRARNAELEGEEAAESAAASNVKTEYDALAGLFNAEPTVPDVEPLPEPEPAAEQPADGEQPA